MKIADDTLKKGILRTVYPDYDEARTCWPVLSSTEYKQIGIQEGNLSQVYKVKLTWSTPTGKTPLELPDSVVVKILATENVRRLFGIPDGAPMDPNLAALLIKVHNAECDFYSIVMKHHVPLVGCQCFLSQRITDLESGPPGFLVLTDVSDKASNVAVVDGVSLDQTLSVMSAYAKLHAWSIENQSAFDQIIGVHSIPTESGFIEGGFNDLKSKWPEMFPGDRLEIFAKKYRDEQDLIDIIDNTQTKFGLPTVLCHMDAWTGNLLFDKEDGWTDGTSPSGPLRAVIDWQGVQKGCPSADLARFIWSSTQPEDRRQHQEQMLRHYYDTLKQSLTDKSLLFDYQPFRESYDRMSIWAVPSAISFTAMNIIKVKPIPDSDPLKEQKMCKALSRAEACVQDGLKLYAKLNVK